QLSINSNTPLTPAEYMAAMQIVHGGQQTILLNSQGEAIGGTVIISQRISSELNSLVVPQGVTVIDLTASGKLNLSGGITDSGSLYVTSFNRSLTGLAIDANNISVQSGGIFSDIVSASTANTLPWLNKADTNLNLNLNSLNNINN